jgi:hypothetical protein
MWGVYRNGKQYGAFHKPSGRYWPLLKDGTFGKAQKTVKGPPSLPVPSPVLFVPFVRSFAPQIRGGGC